MTHFLETTDLQGARVDRVAGIIRGVKILGRISRNGRTYTAEALRNAAGLYEGKVVNVDHLRNSTDRRSYQDRIGRLQNIAAREDGLYGDLHYNPKHALAEQLVWDAEHSPGNVGLSHDAVGKTVHRDGRDVVEQIESVRSVDLVADPASTAGLFEGIDPTQAAAEAKRRQLAEEQRRMAGLTPANRWADVLPVDSGQLIETVSRWRD